VTVARWGGRALEEADHQIRKIRRVTGMRGLAAFYVFLSHLWYEIWPAVPWPLGHGTYPDPAWAAWTGWLYYGHFSVVAFIVISGYCLGQKSFPASPAPFLRNYASYLGRRARRILPPYYVALVGCFLLSLTILSETTGRQWDISLPVSWIHLAINAVLLHDFVEATRINYVFWSVAVEFQLYLLLPLFSRLADRHGAATTGTVAIVGVYLAIGVLVLLGIDAIPPQFLDLVAFFFAGVLLARAERSPRARWLHRLPWNAIALAGFAVLAGMCVALGHETIERLFVLADIPCLALTVGLVMATTGPVARILEGTSAVWLGGISYSLYLVHAPLIHLVWIAGVRPLGLDDGRQFLTTTAISIPVVLAFSWIFHLAFERPFLSRDHMDLASARPSARTTSTSIRTPPTPAGIPT
jgi:peptidoglycan/LPS O-acetylase OafA/YrhL